MIIKIILIVIILALIIYLILNPTPNEEKKYKNIKYKYVNKLEEANKEIKKYIDLHQKYNIKYINYKHNTGKIMVINFATKEDEDNEFYKDDRFFHCADDCLWDEKSPFGFERPIELRGMRNRKCQLTFKLKTMAHINTNNSFNIRTPFGKGKYLLKVGLGDCIHYEDQYPRLNVKIGNNKQKLINDNKYDNIKIASLYKEIYIDSDFISIYDPREPIENKGTINEKIKTEDNRNPVQAVRLTHIALIKL